MTNNSAAPKMIVDTWEDGGDGRGMESEMEFAT